MGNSNVERLRAYRKKREEEGTSLSSSNVQRLREYRLSKGFEDTNNTISESLSGWQDSDTMAKNKAMVQGYYNDLSSYYDLYGKSMAAEQSEAYKNQLDYYGSTLNNWDNASKAYSNYINKEAYDKAQKTSKLADKYRGASYDDIQSALKSATDQDEISYLKRYTDYSSIEDYDKAIAAEQPHIDELSKNGRKVKSAYQEKLKEARNTYEKEHASEAYDYLLEEPDFAEYSSDDSRLYAHEIVQMRDPISRTMRGNIAAYDSLTGNDKAKAVYLYNKFGEEAYLDYMKKMTFVARQNEAKQIEEEFSAQTEEHPVLSAIEFPAINAIVGGAAGIDTVSAIVRDKVKSLITGEEADYNPTTLGVFSTKARQQTSNISQSIKEKAGAVPAFAYDVFATEVPNRIGQLMYGGAYNTIMGLDVFATTYTDAVLNGTSPEKAMTDAFVAGGLETLTEMVGMEWAFGESENAIATILKQAFAEGSEEVVSSLGNLIYDINVNGGEAEYYQNVKNYVAMGYSMEEARKKASLDYIKDVAYQFAVAAFSTVPTTGTSQIARAVQESSAGQFIDRDAVSGINAENLQKKYGDEWTKKASNREIYRAYSDYVGNLQEESTKAEKEATKNAIAQEYKISEEEAEKWTEALYNGDKKALKTHFGEVLRSDLEKGEGWTTKADRTEVDKISSKIRDAFKMVKSENQMAAEKASKTLKTGEKNTVNGKEAQILSMKENKDGSFTVKTSEGNVDAKDVTVTEKKATALTYSANIENEPFKEAYVHYYNGQDIADYDFYARWLYNAGLRGIDYTKEDSEIDYKSILDAIGTASARALYNVGAEQALRQEIEEHNLVSEVGDKYAEKYRPGTFKAGEYSNGKFKENKDFFRNLNRTQKSLYRIIEVFSKLSGVNVRVYIDRNAASENGQFIAGKNGGTIFINLAARPFGDSAYGINQYVVSTLSHELTHWLKANNREAYDILEDAVKKDLQKNNTLDKRLSTEREALLKTHENELKESDKSEEAIKAEMEKYSKKKDLDEIAMEEVVARACEDMLNDSDTMQEVLSFADQDGLTKLQTALNKWFDHIRGFFRDLMGGFHAPNEVVADLQDSYDHLKELWVKGVKEAIAENRKEQKTTESKKAASVKKSEKLNKERVTREINEWLSKTEKNPHKRKEEGGFFNLGYPSEALKTIGFEDIIIRFGKSKIQQTLEDHPEMENHIADIMDVINEPMVILSSSTRFNDSITLFGEKIINGKPLMAAIRISVKDGTVEDYVVSNEHTRSVEQLQNYLNKSIIYYTNPQKEKTNAWLTALGVHFPSATIKYGLVRKLPQSMRSSSTKSVSQPNKQSNNKKSVKMDSEGRTLTTGQQTYFEKSKVRDNQGRLKVMYHGARGAGFTVFNAMRSDDERSLFFVDNNNIAKTYSGTHELFTPDKPYTYDELNNMMTSFTHGDNYLEKDGKDVVVMEVGGNEDYEVFRGTLKEAQNFFMDSLEDIHNEDSANYQVYLNVENPLVIDAKGSNYDEIEWDSIESKEMAPLLKILNDYDWGRNNVSDAEYDKTLARYEELENQLNSYGDISTTRGISAYAQAHGYDGVVFKNLIDYGLYASSSEKVPANVVIVFNADQVKSIYNENPTHDLDIRKSVRLDSVERIGAADVDAKTGTAVYSVRYTLAERYKELGYNSYAEAVGKTAEKIAKQMGVSKLKAEDWIKAEESLSSIILKDAENQRYLDYAADDRYSAIKTDTDYPQGTIDLSNLCRKREIFTKMFDNLQRENPDVLFTAEDIAKIRQILTEANYEVACALCYVEDRRQHIGEIAESFADSYKQALKSKSKVIYRTNSKGKLKPLKITEKQAAKHGLTKGEYFKATDPYVPNQYDLTTYQGYKDLVENHPMVAAAFENFNNARGQSAARLIEGHAEYKREILNWTQKDVDKANNLGGLRVFSFSDFEAIHLIDIVQVVMDCATKGVMIQAYTKVPSFANLVKDTGIKLNRSLIPANKGSGHAYAYINGQAIKIEPDMWVDDGIAMVDDKEVLAFDIVEGIDITDENFLDMSDNKNVGNILVGISKRQIELAMEDDFIDYIIPFHTNQAKAILEVKNIHKWDNYKLSQLDKKINGSKKDHGINIYTDVINKYKIKNKNDFVRAFLNECKNQKYKPRFEEFLKKNSKGDYIYTEGYHKFLVDYKLFDKNGNILKQEAVRPDFDKELMNKILLADKARSMNMKFSDEIMEKVKTELSNENRVVKSVKVDSTGNKLTEDQVKYFENSKIVDENGNLKVMYHGTLKGGFTVFNSKFSDDKTSLFFSDRSLVASSYTNTEKEYNPYIQKPTEKITDAESAKKFLEDFGIATNISSYETSAYGRTNTYWNATDEDGLRVRGLTNKEFISWAEGKRKSNSGLYKVYLNSTNPLIIDCEGKNWANLNLQHLDASLPERMTTRDVAVWAKAQGYDGVYFKNIKDTGSHGKRYIDYGTSNIAVVFNADQVKSVYNEHPTKDKDIRKSAKMDSTGKTLTPGQQNYFKDSKVVDDQGRLLVVYHGTNEEFDTFRPNDFIGEINGVNRIVGWFSEDKSYSEIYGSTKAYYLNIKNPLVLDETAKTLDNWEKFFKQNGVTNVIFDSSVSGKNGQVDPIKGGKFEDGTYYTYFELLDMGNYWYGDGNLTERIQAAGYDGIQTNDEYEKAWMPFNAEAVKSVDNENPTENPSTLKSTKLSPEAQKLVDELTLENKRLTEENTALKAEKGIEQAKAEKKAIIDKITEQSQVLSRWLLTNDKTNPVPQAIKEPLGKLLTSISFTKDDYEWRKQRGALTKSEETLGERMAKISQLLNEIEQDKVNDADAYDLSQLDWIPEFSNEFAKIKDTVASVESRQGEYFNLGKMTTEDLQSLLNMITALKSAITNMNKCLSAHNKMSVSGVGKAIISYLDEVGQKKHDDRILQFLEIDNTVPFYFFKRLGPGGQQAFKLLMDGMNQYAFEAKQIEDYAKKTFSGKDVLSWRDEVKTFQVDEVEYNAEQGKDLVEIEKRTIQMTVPQIMSLYCLSKRDQAVRHLNTGGIKIGDFKVSGEKNPVRQLKNVTLTKKDIEKITSSLTKEQIEVADKLQEFMNTVCQKWGNEITMKRFGFKGMTEKNYFPINVDRNQLSSETRQRGSSLYQLLNMGFTKPINPKAKNPIEIFDIFEVFAIHSTEMAQYNSLALPVLDVIRIWNYKDLVMLDENEDKAHWNSVKASIENTIGEKGNQYIGLLLADLNGDVSGGRADDLVGRFMKNYKTAAVAANLQVAALQPLAYIRAGYMIDSKYLTKGMAMKSTDDALKYCGIAVWKEMGFYNTSIHRGLEHKIMQDESKTESIIDKSLYLAGKADEWTWSKLWNACLLETKDKYPTLKDQELYEKTAERLTEVIYGTQVVDSVLTRSQLMRDKTMYSKMVTAFQSEPTLGLNVLMDATESFSMEARAHGKQAALQKYGKTMYRAALVYLISSAVESLFRTVIGRIRKYDGDEDDESFLEDFFTRFIEELNPLGKIPIIKDVVNIGWDVLMVKMGKQYRIYTDTRMDEDIFEKIGNATLRLINIFEGKKVNFKTLYEIAKGIDASGLPVSNTFRTFKTAWNNTIGRIWTSLAIK